MTKIEEDRYDDRQPRWIKTMAKSTAAPSATIVYLAYGASSVIHQTLFSIQSLLKHRAAATAGERIVVYTDQPGAFDHPFVETVPVDQTRLQSWLGPSDYIHRRKSCALLDAGNRFPGKIVFVDSDTYFMRTPSQLFDRVGPGRTCLHVCEGLVGGTGTPFDVELVRQLSIGTYTSRAGEVLRFSRKDPMWNTGIIGFHTDDMNLLREALNLADQIWAHARPDGPFGKKIHHAEQFSVGYFFAKTRISEAIDTVYHYWLLHQKRAFAPALAEVFSSSPALSNASGYDALFARRPRDAGASGVLTASKMMLRRAAISLNVPLKGVRRSVL